MSLSTTADKLWNLLTPTEHRRAILLLGLTIVGMILETLGVGLIVPVIAIITQPEYAARFPVLQRIFASFGYAQGVTTIVVVTMIGLAVIFTLKNLFLAFLTWYQTRFAFGIQARLSNSLFGIYMHQPYAFHLQRNSAQLLRNVTGEVDMLRGSALLPGMMLLSDSFVLVGLFALLLYVEPLGSLVVIGILGVVAWAAHMVTRRHVSRWGLFRQQLEGARIQHLQQGLGAAKDVKLLGREREFLKQFQTCTEQSARVGHLQFTLQQLPRMWLEVLAVCGLAALVIVMVTQGRALESVLPTLGLFAAAAFRVLPSANRVFASVQLLRYGLPVIDSLHRELRLAPPPPLVAHAGMVIPFRDRLEFDNVTFSYAGAHKAVLNGVSLCIRRGESVGFIGSSGAGKSTLVDILLGLLDPTGGELRMDGKNIDAQMRNWQDQIGYVPQSIYLTDDTLRRNIAFGLPNAAIDEAAVWRTVRAAQLDEFVQSLPQGLETVVGERGVRLSGGQRQRIGIARALYHDPAVLVLDEATSSLDIATERDVMEAVTALQGDKTVLIVAHRLSTLEHCDRLYRVQEGTVVEERNAPMLANSFAVAPPGARGGLT